MASIVRLCDLSSPSAPSVIIAVPTQAPASSSAKPRFDRARGPRNPDSANRQQNPRRQSTNNRDTMRAVKNRSACVRCGNYGHWYADYNQDGSLRPRMKPRPDPSIDAVNDAASSRRQNRPVVAAPAKAAPVNPNDVQENYLAFNMAHVMPAHEHGGDSRI